MAVPLAIASDSDHLERSLLHAHPMDRDFATVMATVMMDVLVAIKIDLTNRALDEKGTAEELQNCVDRAGITIEAAIRDLKQVAEMCREEGLDVSLHHKRETGP